MDGLFPHVCHRYLVLDEVLDPRERKKILMKKKRIEVSGGGDKGGIRVRDERT